MAVLSQLPKLLRLMCTVLSLSIHDNIDLSLERCPSFPQVFWKATVSQLVNVTNNTLEIVTGFVSVQRDETLQVPL
jgi:hypothetical protein